MAWDEWEELKAEAVGRSSAHMQLNQYPADQGGEPPPGAASEDLKSDTGRWGTRTGSPMR